jgi:hypothetical protein
MRTRSQISVITVTEMTVARSSGAPRARAQREGNAIDEAARDEQRPALEVDAARKGREDSRCQNEPAGRFAEDRSRDARDVKGSDPELRD